MARFTDRLRGILGPDDASGLPVGLRIRPPQLGVECRLTRDKMVNVQFVQPEVVSSTKFENRGHRRLLAHPDFYEWLIDPRVEVKLKKRAKVVALQILTRGYAPTTKPVKGRSAGWQRVGLGGKGGSHDYLWYANGGTAIGRQLDLQENEYLLRFVRFHDDTDQPVPPSKLDDYLTLSSEDLLSLGACEEESPFNSEQHWAALVHSEPICKIRGYPGSGKTTAIQFAASSGRSRSILYLTFNRKLAEEARSYFDVFTPQGSKIQVMSFEQFLENMADIDEGTLRLIPPNEAAEIMERKLKVNPAIGFGEWKGHLDELYSEFHSFAVGSSLPFAFRGVEGSDQFAITGEGFRTHRSDQLGKSAELAADFLEQISDPRVLFQLFPGPCISRMLLAGADEPPPPGFDSFDGIFVDEVQDLTLTELALIFNVGARISLASGRMPHIVVAGDESQTVRPTDFSWSALNGLAGEFFPGVKLDDRPLASNLRSPERIAKVVEASGRQYDLFERGDRPRGQVQTAIDQDLPGQVTYCQIPSETDLKTLMNLVERSPRVRLVYPGSRLPDDVQRIDEGGAIWTADEVKGLDFETVIVLDAGERQVALRSRLEESNNQIGRVWGRTLADQFRVCVSRSTSKLILTDRQYIGESGSTVAKSALLKLMDANDERPDDLDFIDLGEELNVELEPDGILVGISDDLPQLMAQNPDRALRRIMAGQRRLEEALVVDAVNPSVISKFKRVSAVALATMAIEGSVSTPRSLLEGDAMSLFSYVGLDERYTELLEVLRFFRSKSGQGSYAAEIGNLRVIRETIKTDLPELYEHLERASSQWVSSSLKAGPPTTRESLRQLKGNIDLVVSTFENSQTHLAGVRESGLGTWGRALMDDGRFEEALVVITDLQGLDDVRAVCLENLGEFEAAIEPFLAAGDRSSAIRAARRAGLTERATEINGGEDLQVSQSLEWLSEVRRLFETHAPGLLDEEKVKLGESFSRLMQKGSR